MDKRLFQYFLIFKLPQNLTSSDRIPVQATSPDSTGCVLAEESSDKFPGDIFTNDQRRHGGFLFHVFVAFYCFIVIAFVCNDYFLPTVDCICQDLNLSQDVARATFMALATCTPELFANLIGTFVTQSDLGVGAVVGSAVFNTLGVPACGGIAAAMVIKLKVYPLARDCGIYMVVLAVLAIMLWDEHIYWYESLILLVLYFVYGIIMFCDRKMSKAAKKVLKKANSFDSSKSIKSARSDVRDGAGDGVYRPTHFQSDQLFSSIQRARRLSSLREVNRPKVDESGNGNVEANEPGKEKLCVKPDGVMSMCWWVFTLPVEIALWLTVPDCKVRRKLYPFTFCMCIVWIGLSSYVVSWMVALVGTTFTISDSVMGITFLAMGGSMPEACSSVINARLGIASMSISNALGANTLDILLCLGLPWMIKTILPASLGGGPIKIQSAGLVYNTAAQIACVAILFIAAALNRFYFNRILGFICLFMYLTLIGIIIVIETNLFGWTSDSKTSCS
ncbi:hypothetical protein J6590_028305 [Homalodisca vitripennis]|nr:hypothetical protein J6590_028305 [Homalodisca vitripennis]